MSAPRPDDDGVAYIAFAAIVFVYLALLVLGEI